MLEKEKMMEDVRKKANELIKSRNSVAGVESVQEQLSKLGTDSFLFFTVICG